MIWAAWNFCAACVGWSTKLLDDIVFSFERRVETYHRGVACGNWTRFCVFMVAPLRSTSRFGSGKHGAPEIVGVVYLHGDGAVERRQFGVINRVKIVQVLLSADKAARSRFACQLQNFLVVVIGVAVMIWKEFVADDIWAPSA